MTLDEAIGCLSKIGVDVSKATLNRYVRDGLVTAPERGGYGRGGGRWANYSVSAVAEAATAWALLTKKTQTGDFFRELQYLRFTPELVALARNGGIHSFYRGSLLEVRAYCPPEFLKELEKNDLLEEIHQRREAICVELEEIRKASKDPFPTTEIFSLMDEQNDLEIKEREIWESCVSYPTTPMKCNEGEEEHLATLVGEVNIPDFFPKEAWVSSAGAIDALIELASVHVYAKIYGGMLLKVLNCISKSK